MRLHIIQALESDTALRVQNFWPIPSGMNMEAFLSITPFVLACVAAAAPGVIFRPGEWYQTLTKPSWRPPDWLFGPVWLVLYISIAVSDWMVWREGGFDEAAVALVIYIIQLGFNALWSIVFFGLHRPDWAFLEIVCLWFSILATIAAFLSIDRVAAYLLIPYAGWVSFAVVLNFRVWRLNPERSSW